MAFPYGDRWSDHVRDLVAALYIAASHEIVHRDVRQANMMLWPGANAAIGEGEDPSKSRAYLIDWGFAAAVDTVCWRWLLRVSEGPQTVGEGPACV